MNRVVTPTSPTGDTKRDFAIFSSKFQLLSNKVCCKVSLCENFQRQSCSYIIPLSNFPQTDCGRRPHLPIICAQSDPPPSENADFDKFRLIVLQPWELARKIQLAPIGSRPRAFQRAIDEPCTLPLYPKGGAKRNFLHLAWPFISSLHVIIDISNLICGLNIANPSLRTTNCPWKGRGHCHLTSLIFGK